MMEHNNECLNVFNLLNSLIPEKINLEDFKKTYEIILKETDNYLFNAYINPIARANCTS